MFFKKKYINNGVCIYTTLKKQYKSINKWKYNTNIEEAASKIE